MRIKKAARVIVLSESETRTWESGEPEAYELVRRVRKLAAELAAPGKPVEIYASARAGGWMADQVEVES